MMQVFFSYSIIVALLLFSGSSLFAQERPEFSGQVSGVGSYSPDNERSVFAGLRYIPEFSYGIPIDSSDRAKRFDFLGSANLSSSLFADPFTSADLDGDIALYRLWARYTGKQYEVRVGLQKIDFGASTLLRPLQWFNQIDPRDPLGLTNGVYGVLGRYYFSNNANIWLWGLYGNEQPRGFDAVATNAKVPELGARVQYPVPSGEIAISYHHRTADASTLLQSEALDEIPEDRFGFDAKFDVVVGLWAEASFIHKNENIGLLTNQGLLNMGMDYTFGIGSGLNVVAEHLISSLDEETFGFGTTNHITATNISYPIGFFDNLSTLFYYSWETEQLTFFLNYQHQFKKLTAYAMAFYNPDAQQGIQQNELINNFSGPGFRLMLVYNH